MRYAIIAAALLTPSLSQSQDITAQINRAVDAAERVCLVGSRYKFSVDASGNLTILKLAPGGEGKLTVDSAEAKGSQFFENEVIRRSVEQDIRDCMKSQWPAVIQAMNLQKTQPYIRLACTGEIEGNCPGAHHDLFYTCGYALPDAQMAEQVCKGVPSKFVRLNTSSGNQCGYALIEITCTPQ
jgi:hypothetical protein